MMINNDQIRIRNGAASGAETSLTLGEHKPGRIKRYIYIYIYIERERDIDI